MAAIAGLLTLASGPSTNEWVSEYQETILVRNAKGMNNGTTLFGLCSRLKNEPAETTEYNWFERDPVTRQVYQVGAIASTSQTTGFDFSLTAAGTEDVSGLLPVGTILRSDATNELIRITTSADGAYVVERGFGQTSGVNVADDTLWVIITLGKAEGASPVEAVFETASTLTNYIQTFNASVKLANAFKASKLRTDIEGPLRERRVQALERIARDIELAYFFGEKDRSGSGAYLYYTGGIKAAVDALGTITNNLGTTANVLNGGAGSGTALANVQTWLQSFMTVGSENKLFLCGPATYAAWSNFANKATNGFRITGSENVFGMNIQAIQTPYGELDMAMHPLFKEISAFNDWGFVIDLAMLVQKTMEPLFLEPNIQTPGKDSYEEQFRAKYGLKLKFAQAFGYCYDLSIIN